MRAIPSGARAGKYLREVEAGLGSAQCFGDVGYPDEPRPKMLGGVEAEHQQRIFGGEAWHFACRRERCGRRAAEVFHAQSDGIETGK